MDLARFCHPLSILKNVKQDFMLHALTDATIVISDDPSLSQLNANVEASLGLNYIMSAAPQKTTIVINGELTFPLGAHLRQHRCSLMSCP